MHQNFWLTNGGKKLLKVPKTITNKKIGLIVVSKQCEILMSSQLPLYIFSVKDSKKKLSR